MRRNPFLRRHDSAAAAPDAVISALASLTGRKDGVASEASEHTTAEHAMPPKGAPHVAVEMGVDTDEYGGDVDDLLGLLDAAMLDVSAHDGTSSSGTSEQPIAGNKPTVVVGGISGRAVGSPGFGGGGGDDDDDSAFDDDLAFLGSHMDAIEQCSGLTDRAADGAADGFACPNNCRVADASCGHRMNGGPPLPFDASVRYTIRTLATRPSQSHPGSEFIAEIAAESPHADAVHRRKQHSLAQEGGQDASASAMPPLRLVLRGRWSSTALKVGDVLRVDSPAWMPSGCGLGEWLVDDAVGIAIVAPDCLISGTRVAESFTCVRRGVLNERFKGPSNAAGVAILAGSMLHEVFQRALASRNFSEAALAEYCEATIATHLEDICCLGDTEAGMRDRLVESAAPLGAWSRAFVREAPSPTAVITYDGASDAPVGGDRRAVSIRSLVDCEENYWSPKFGIKGKVDATIEACIALETADGLPRALGGLPGNVDTLRTCIVPLELKTGKGGGAAAAAHRAQLMLYSLMMAERHASSVGEGGLLFYLRSGEMTGVSATRAEIRDLLIARNELAQYLSVEDAMPPMLQQERACRNCFQSETCAMYHRAVEDGTTATSGMGSTFEEHTGHLSPAQAAYFKRWVSLVSMEAAEARGGRQEVWTMTSLVRESRGRCFARMALSGAPESVGDSFLYTFVRCGAVPGARMRGDGLVGPVALTDVGLSTGDPIVVGIDGGECAIANGFLRDVRANAVTVSLDRKLPAAYALAGSSAASTGAGDPLLFRIDRDDFSAGMGLVRQNVATLLRRGSDVRRRHLIVDLVAPQFRDESEIVCALSASATEGLNSDQIGALGRVLAADDYAIVLGMPGTGKTTTIARAVRLLVERGKTVLITSYTHTAVDTILLKLIEEGVPFARLGSPDKVHPAIRKHTPDGAGPFRTVAELEGFYRSRPVVATTCLGISHPLFMRRSFDVCIVDEASQITEPVCLGPLQLARCFVLVGDHNQLPPLVVSAKARDEGLAVSLFRRLHDAHPRAVAALEHQYRMNADILLLTNTLIYNNRLKCGTPAVAQSSLAIPNPAALPSFQSQPAVGANWLRDLIDPARKVVFVDTDLVPAPESKFGDSVRNDIEAALVAQLASGLVACGVPPSSVGIISPYRAQLTAIRGFMRHVRGSQGLEVHTVDKYQGRDKDCIIVSLVRSNSAGNVGDLMKDWRRVNVAFTRAKQKLVIFGSMGTFRHDELFGRFRLLLEENQWVYQLPAGAQSVYASFNTTQTTQATQSPHASPHKHTAMDACHPDATAHSPRVIDGRQRARLGPIALNVLSGV
eukprot:Opistho-2@31535